MAVSGISSNYYNNYSYNGYSSLNTSWKENAEAEAEKRRGSELYLKYRSGELDKEAFQGWKAQEERQGQQRRARQEETPPDF